MLKPLGYATGQFGKNHFGDLNKYLPTVHGFDEFYGNLYHLNAEEEPEQFDYPHKDQFPRLYELALPRGVLDCKATDEVSTEPDDAEVRPGRQADHRGHRPAEQPSAWRPSTTTSPTAPSTTSSASTRPTIRSSSGATSPTCTFTHTKPESAGRPGCGSPSYHDTMIDHDKNVGTVLDVLDELGIADDTIVIYSTDNGPHRNSLARRRHDAVPQREEHQLGGRLPGAGADPLARKDQGGQRLQRHHPAPRLAADAAGRRRRPRRQRQAEEGLSRSGPTATPSTRCTSTGSTCCRT